MVNTAIKRGEYLLLAVDGTEKIVSEKPRIDKLCKEIGCQYFDTVTLKRHKGQPSVIMLVDDNGMIDRKPVNPKATEIYHSVCKSGTVWAIHGDVAIVNDKDFK